MLLYTKLYNRKIQLYIGLEPVTLTLEYGSKAIAPLDSTLCNKLLLLSITQCVPIFVRFSFIHRYSGDVIISRIYC